MSDAPSARGGGVERNRVIAGVDGSAPSKEAARWAAATARRRGHPLHLVHAFAWPAAPYYVGAHFAGAIAEPYGEELQRTAEEMLAAVTAEIRADHPGISVTSELLLGPTAPLLIELSQHAALIVVGSRGLGGFTGLLVGSVGTQLAGHAACPLVVVRDRPHPPSHEVVVGVDYAGETDAALEFALAEAAQRGGRLTVVHAWASPPHEGLGAAAPRTYEPEAITAELTRLVEERVAPWREKFPEVPVRVQVRHGRPADNLVAAGEGADLLVVGSHGHGALHDLFMGSVSNRVLHHAHGAVAVVPTRERARP